MQLSCAFFFRFTESFHLFRHTFSDDTANGSQKSLTRFKSDKHLNYPKSTEVNDTISLEFHFSLRFEPFQMSEKVHSMLICLGSRSLRMSGTWKILHSFRARVNHVAMITNHSRIITVWCDFNGYGLSAAVEKVILFCCSRWSRNCEKILITHRRAKPDLTVLMQIKTLINLVCCALRRWT